MENNSQNEVFRATLHVLDRSEVPAHSFRYMQGVDEGEFAVAPHLHAVCTWCSHQLDDGSFTQVLVAHFLHRSWDDACETARDLVRGGTSVAIVRPTQ